MDPNQCPAFSPTVSPGEILYDGIIFDSNWERKQSKPGENFANGQVLEENLENPPPAECPSNVLVVPESPNAAFICPVTTKSYYVPYPLSASRADWLGACTTAQLHPKIIRWFLKSSRGGVSDLGRGKWGGSQQIPTPCFCLAPPHVFCNA